MLINALPNLQLLFEEATEADLDGLKSLILDFLSSSYLPKDEFFEARVHEFEDVFYCTEAELLGRELF